MGDAPERHAREPSGARAVRRPQSLLRFIRESGLFPSCDRGHVNLYQPFLERTFSLARPGGRIGLVLPWGLAVDDGAAGLRRRMFAETEVDTIVGLDNADGLFPIHRGLRFLTLITTMGKPTGEFRARFGVRTAVDLSALPTSDASILPHPEFWPIRLTPTRVAAIGGASGRIPDLRRTQDLEWLDRLLSRHPRLGAGWGLRFGRELNATDDRKHFGRHGLPIIDGKHVQPFVVDARAVTRRLSRARAARLLPDDVSIGRGSRIGTSLAWAIVTRSSRRCSRRVS